MSGHSKWHTIRHKKALLDAKKGKIFTKLGRELLVASKLGGEDPQSNYRLRLAIEKAKEANMPSNKIHHAIQKGVGKNPDGENKKFEDILYEAYGSEGIAFLIQALTDNRNRTVSEIRQIFNRYGGSLAESGSVAWLFEKVGYLSISLKNEKNINYSEEKILNQICKFDLFDFKQENDYLMIYSKIQDFENLKNELKNLTIEENSIIYLAKNLISVAKEKSEKLYNCYEALEENIDIQEIYWNLNLQE